MRRDEIWAAPKVGLTKDRLHLGEYKVYVREAVSKELLYVTEFNSSLDTEERAGQLTSVRIPFQTKKG